MPLLPLREIYCPAHFGNAYEAMWPREMAAYLAELKFWGFNRYADWITATDITNPYHSDTLWSLGQEQLDRKRKAFLAAQSLGMAINVMLTPNHVYVDQVHPDILATKGPRISGQLVCPSTREGRKIILDNAADILRGLAVAGIRVDTITAAPYDYGGCACERCSPWLITFARLMKEIHVIAAEHHAGVEPWFCCWWWTANEHRQIAEWCEAEAPGWLKGMTLHIDYDQTRLPDVPLPAGCRKLAFLHVGYGDTRKCNDIYGKYGPVIAAERIPATLHDIAAQGAEGYQAYSEGLFDDVNKALLAGISSGQFPDADAAMAAYSRRYFAAEHDQAMHWSKWLTVWGNRANVDFSTASAAFDKLAATAEPSWRLDQWRSKLKLESLDRAIGSPAPDNWSPENLNLAEAFWAEQEHLNRDVYRLGPTRHILAPKFAPPVWYDSWHQATGAASDQAGFHPGA